jgi:hypothetical protein
MFPALVIVPSLQICWTLFSILSGMLYFHEYEGMRAGPTAMFVIGVAVSRGDLAVCRLLFGCTSDTPTQQQNCTSTLCNESFHAVMTVMHGISPVFLPSSALPARTCRTADCVCWCVPTDTRFTTRRGSCRPVGGVAAAWQQGARCLHWG